MSFEYTLLSFYKNEFVRINVAPKRGGAALQHCAWMVEEMLNPIDNEDIGKINRWIGFVQGVLWKEGIYTIDQMRQQTTDAKVGEYHETV